MDIASHRKIWNKGLNTPRRGLTGFHDSMIPRFYNTNYMKTGLLVMFSAAHNAKESSLFCATVRLVDYSSSNAFLSGEKNEHEYGDEEGMNM